MIPIDVPIALPVNLNPMLGQIGLADLHVAVAVAILLLGFALACSVILWKILHPIRQTVLQHHTRAQRRDFDQAA